MAEVPETGVNPAPGEDFAASRAASQAGGANKLGEEEKRIVEAAEGVREMARVAAKILGQAMEVADKIKERAVSGGNIGNPKRAAFNMELTADTARKAMSIVLSLYRELLSAWNEIEEAQR